MYPVGDFSAFGWIFCVLYVIIEMRKLKKKR